MNSNKKRLKVFSLFAAMSIFFAFSSSFPSGRTGAPGDGLCSNCHGGSGGGFDGTITLSGVPSDPLPGTVYTLTVDVDVTGGNPVRGGFSLVALDGSNNNAGDLANPDGNSSLKASGGREYWGHEPALMFGGGSNISFDAEWTAPNITDDVTFYMSAILGNGSGSAGDKTLTEELTVTIAGSMPIELDFSSTPTTCFEGNDGTATVIPSGGMAPYEYEWENGEDTDMIVNLESGSYEVTVTDDNGETMVGSVFVNEPNEIEIFPEIIAESCPGNEDGIVELNPDGGTGSLMCEWDFDEGCDQDGLEPGFYDITITDENDCQRTFTIEVPEADPIIITTSSTDANNGSDGSATASATGGLEPYTFKWSNGLSESGVVTSTINNLTPGTYVVEVIDDNNCMMESSIVVMGAMCNLEIEPIVSNPNCHDSNDGNISVIASGANGNLNYQWSNGSDTATLDSITSGMFAVTVTDEAGCSQVASNIIVTAPDSLQSTLLVRVNPSCQNSNNGRITIGVNGGDGNYTINWSHGPTNDTMINGIDTLINIPDTLTDLNVGTYIYTIHDGNNCTLVDSVTLMNGDLLAPFIMIEEEIEVELDENGMASALSFAQIDMGTFDNCALDSISFDTGEFDCDDIGIQNFELAVFDTNGNSSTASVSVVVVEYFAPEIDCSLSNVNTNSCEAIFYTVPFASDNCDVASVALVDGLASGSIFPPGDNQVTFRATDGCGNSSDCTFVISVASDLSIDLVDVNPTSCGENNGSLSVTASGGQPPYTFAPFEMADNISAGVYTITVSDSGGCEVTIEVEVPEGSGNFGVDVSTVNPSCAGLDDGSIEVDPTGGVGPYEIEITNVTDPFNLPAGSYEITVTDSEGCSFSTVAELVDPPLLEIISGTITTTDPCFGLDESDVTFEIVGGEPPFESEVELLNGVGIITVTDAAGCIVQENFDYEIFEQLAISNSIITPVNANDPNSGGVDIEVIGGTDPFVYQWIDASGMLVSDMEDLVNVPIGTYQLIITDANGCIVESFFEVSIETSTFEQEIILNDIDFYPNPVSDKLIFEFKKDVPNRIHFINTQGQIIATQINISNNLQLDMSEFGPGLYLIQFEYKEVSATSRFLKL